MKGLYDWLEHYESTKPFEAFWDPRREIRSAIEKDLKMISSNKIDWQQLIPNAEWLGQKVRRRNRSGPPAGKPAAALRHLLRTLHCTALNFRWLRKFFRRSIITDTPFDEAVLTTNRFQGLKFPLLYPPPRGARRKKRVPRPS